jgi:hypothetical protein
VFHPVVIRYQYLLAVKLQGNPIWLSIHQTNEERLNALTALKKLGKVEHYTLGCLERNQAGKWRIAYK